jgi:hypothetical protein
MRPTHTASRLWLSGVNGFTSRWSLVASAGIPRRRLFWGLLEFPSQPYKSEWSIFIFACEMVIVKTSIYLVQRLDFYSIDYVYTKIKFQFLLSSFIHHNPLSSPKQKELERLGKWGEIWREMGIGWKGGFHPIS